MKALTLSAAMALALCGTAHAAGTHFGASANQYIDSSVQISSSDCQTLSVDSARSACMQQVGGHATAGVGATAGSSGMGMTEGGTMNKSTKHKRNKRRAHSQQNSGMNPEQNQ